MRQSPILPALLTTLVVLGASTTASAQTRALDFTVGAATDNRQRDISKSDGKAATWGRATWNTADRGLYVQAAYETLDMGQADLGWAVFSGIRRSVAGYGLDLQISYKALIDARSNFDHDTFEAKADLSRTFGQTSTRLRAEYSPDGLGATKAWVWVSAYAAQPLTPKLTASAEIGYRDQANSLNYTGYNAGLTYGLSRQTALDLRWHGTDAAPRTPQYKDGIVASLTHSF